MKKALLVLVLAVALTMMFAAAAYAEHAPSNYSTWSTAVGGNSGLATPHNGYAANTVKCSVCHSVHRSANAGSLIRNQVNGAWIPSGSEPTQMLLRSSVAESCEYCHIETAAGGVRLWNGNAHNWGEVSAFSGGYAHNNTACSNCHAVHGANTFGGGAGSAAQKALKYTAQNVLNTQTFSGPEPLRWGLNPNVAGNIANHTYLNPATGESVLVGIQDEIFTQDNPLLVDPLNKAQFSSLAGVIGGFGAINDAVGADMKDLQVGAFCTTCHGSMYASDSFQVVNVDQDVCLFGGTYGVWKTIPGVAESGTWKTKGHPVIDATDNFAASGSSIGTGKTVAWADADTCRKCHDAGTDDAAPGVVYSSWPHVTPGYYRFMGAGENAADYAAIDVQADMVDDATGWLEAGEMVSLTKGASPNEFEGYKLYPGQNYKSDDPGNPQLSSHIGTDGLCLKCHVKAQGQSPGVGHSY